MWWLRHWLDDRAICRIMAKPIVLTGIFIAAVVALGIVGISQPEQGVLEFDTVNDMNPV